MKHLGLHFRFRDNFESEEEASAVRHIACGYFMISGTLALYIITVLECLMLIYVSAVGLGSPIRNFLYTCEYIFLLLCTIASLCYLLYARNHKDDIAVEQRLYRLQMIYSAAILAWAAGITFLDSYYSGYAAITVYMTVLLILPVIVYSNPLTLLLIEMCGDIAVLMIIIFETRSRGMLVNFSVYALLAALAGFVLQYTKTDLYLKYLQLRRRAARDSLTGLYNRLALDEDGEKLWRACLAEGRSVAAVMADLDDFKSVNDTYGHPVGDRCLIELADVLRGCCVGQNAECYRYGGEEFLILIDGADGKGAGRFASRLHNRLSECGPIPGSGKPLTVSAGIAVTVPAEDDSLSELIGRADAQLYRAKRAGKNCTCM